MNSNKTRRLIASTEIVFCRIPAGSFLRDGHTVRLTRDFWLAKYPVTQRVWNAIMGNNPSRHLNNDDLAPVERVSWYDAHDFLKRAGCEFRLPTEAEWEYACKAGTTGPYNVDGAGLGQLGWYERNASKTTHPVGEKKSNALGLYDMHGNVREWCQDNFGAYERGDSTDPTGPRGAGVRVLRGGSWIDDAWYCRAARRDARHPSHRLDFVGFRPVRAIDSSCADAGTSWSWYPPNQPPQLSEKGE